MIAVVRVAAARSRPATACALPSWHFEHERAAGSEHARRRRHERLGLTAFRRARRAAPTRAPRDPASRARSAATYGGFETTRSNGPSIPVEQRRLDEARRRARGDRRSRARARAHPARGRSRVTRASGRSSAIASAIAPLPGADVDDTRLVDRRRAAPARARPRSPSRAAGRARARRSRASAAGSPTRRARTRAAHAGRGARGARAPPLARPSVSGRSCWV